MSIEVEQKYPVADRRALLAKIATLDAVAQPPVTQVDTYYAHPARDFAATDEALRIRRVGEENFITYKGPKLDATTKTRREIELPLAGGEVPAAEWDELLLALSFRQVTQVSKVRQTYRVQRDRRTIEIAVDQVQDVGDFVELELVVAGQSEIGMAQQLLETVANELLLVGAERRSYLELLLLKK